MTWESPHISMPTPSLGPARPHPTAASFCTFTLAVSLWECPSLKTIF